MQGCIWLIRMSQVWDSRCYIIPNLSSTLLNFIHPISLCPCFQMPWSLVECGSCLLYQIRDVRRGSHLTLQIPHPFKTAPQSESVYLLNFCSQHSLTTSSRWARLRQSFCEGKEIRERQGRAWGAVRWVERLSSMRKTWPTGTGFLSL